MSEAQQLLPFLSVSAKATPRWPNQVIEAGAGTGKTTRIVHDVVLRMIEDEHLRAESIVLMTFTEKAAAEIAERIRWALVDLGSQLENDTLRWPSNASTPVLSRPATEARKRAVRRHLEQAERLRSQTIHSFCQMLLRLHPLEAGLEPDFEIVQGYALQTLIDETYDAWIRDELTIEGKGAWFEPAFRKFKFLDRLRAAILSAANRRELIDNDELSLGSIDEFERTLQPHLDALRDLTSDEIAALAPSVGELAFAVRAMAMPREEDEWTRALATLQRLASRVEMRKGRKELRDRINPAVKFLRASADALESHRGAVAVREAARSFVRALDAAKRERGVVDFDDLLLFTARLLQNDDIAERMRARFDLIFVDEFQDTDRVQAAIVDRLIHDRNGALLPSRITLVGDPKQSIYSFRRADPIIFARMVHSLTEAGAQRNRLDKQYRSDPELLRAINAMFSKLFPTEESAAIDPAQRPVYYPLEAAKSASRPLSEPRVRFLGCELEEGVETARMEAESVAAFIRARIERGASARSFVILLRKLRNVSIWADVFERRGIDLLLPPGRTLLERRVVVDLMTVLRAIAYPFDLAATTSAARTPYIAANDTEIVHAVFVERAAAPPPVTALIERFARRAETSTVGELVDLLIAEAGIETMLLLRKDGAQQLRHLSHFRTLIDDFDLVRGGSLREFVDEIQRRRDTTDEAEPPAVEENADAVRLMTVHASKGLEFDTVILPELGARTGDDTLDIDAIDDPASLVFRRALRSFSADHRFVGSMSLHDVITVRDEAEAERLFYVAVTRARDEVVFVTQLTKLQLSGFWKPLNFIFGFTLPDISAAFPEEAGASRVCETAFTLDSEPFLVAYERASRIDGEDETLLRFADARLQQVAANHNVDVNPEPPELPPLLTRGEAARLLATNRKRQSGIAVHRALELWDFAEASAGAVARQAGKEFALAPAVIGELTALLRKLSRTETARLIRSSPLRERELPLFEEVDGQVREGRIDLLVRDDAGWIVVDYKTGSRWEGRDAKDGAQVADYCRRISQLYGESCRGIVWYVDEPGESILNVESEPPGPGV